MNKSMPLHPAGKQNPAPKVPKHLSSPPKDTRPPHLRGKPSNWRPDHQRGGSK